MHRSYQQIDRRKTKIVNVGDLNIGGNSPILVQITTGTTSIGYLIILHKNTYRPEGSNDKPVRSNNKPVIQGV